MLYRMYVGDRLEGFFAMGTLVAVLSRRSEDVTETAVEMVEAVEPKGSEAYGIASPTMVRTVNSLPSLKKLSMKSSVAVGYAFSRILAQDKPQPLRLKDAALVFDGRIYSDRVEKSDAETAGKKLERDPEQIVKVFVEQTEGDFALAVAEHEKILAARDPVGVRPLYYGESPDFAALASERKALWRIGIRQVHSFPPGCVCLVDKRVFKFKVAKKILYSQPKPITMETAARRLQTLLEHSIKERTSGLKEVAVAFSGGLDSSIIASLMKKTGTEVVLVHVSLKDRPEVESARQAAKMLKLPLYSHLYALQDVAQAIQTVTRTVEEPDPVKLSIAIPIYWTAQKTAEMGCKVIFAGQGADELFGGYRRYLDDYVKRGREKVQRAIFSDIIGLHEANLERDFKICNRFNLELRLPFATYRMARFAMDLPLYLKMERKDSSLRKLVLRRVAKNLGLPRSIVNKPKGAIQYTTGINDAVKKLAKQVGMSMNEYVRRVFETVIEGETPQK